MPKSKYTANLSNGESITVEAVSGPKAILAAEAATPEGIEVRSVFKEVPVGHGKAWGRSTSDPVVAAILDAHPVICSECSASVPFADTKIVTRERPLRPGQRVFHGQATHEEMRVCNTHDVVTNWPKH